MINNFSKLNIYEKPKAKSKLSSQMLYGEKFKIISKKKGWIKIKTNFDKYCGYVSEKKFLKSLKTTKKVNKIKTKIYKKIKNKFKPTKQFLYFASKVSIINRFKDYIEYDKNRWIKVNALKNINYYEKNFTKIIRLFLNTRYLWGGKSSAGIDCSALIQLYFYYNDIFFHRDTKDQIKFLKKNPKKKKYDKNCLIFWKGHVAYCLNKRYLIHAYGPKKKVLIMNTKKTIEEIKFKSKLTIKDIIKINVN